MFSRVCDLAEKIRTTNVVIDYVVWSNINNHGVTLLIWIGIYKIFNYFNNISSHPTSQGTPFVLLPFIIIIETIRLVIRSLILAIH
jgi:hypothetical protein